MLLQRGKFPPEVVADDLCPLGAEDDLSGVEHVVEVQELDWEDTFGLTKAFKILKGPLEAILGTHKAQVRGGNLQLAFI